MKSCALRTRNRGVKELEIRKDNLANSITSVMTDSLVLDTPRLIRTQSRSMKNTSQIIKTMETSQNSKQINSQTLTYWSVDFHVRLSQLLEKEKALQTLEERSSLTSLGFSKVKNQECSYWKTSKDCYLMTVETLSKQLSPRLLNWGMTWNDKCLTARISESLKTVSVCSLSDILEKKPDQKYFLSPKTTARILSYQPSRHVLPQTQTE